MYIGFDRKLYENRCQNVSEIDDGKNSKNDPKMDPKLEPGTIKNQENRGPRCIQISIVFLTVFLTRFFDFLAKMCDFGSQMGMSKVTPKP